MQLVEMELKDLHAAEYNPRIEIEPGMPEFIKLKNAIERFDMVEPVVWNKRTGNVIGGAQRLAVMRHLGKTTTLVSVIDVDEAQEKLLNVALNKIKGSWDIEKLESLFNDIDYADLSTTGFDTAEIALFYEKYSDEFDTHDTVDEIFGTVETHGESWVITLKFDTIDAAKVFVEKENWRLKLKDGTHTAVYRIED